MTPQEQQLQLEQKHRDYENTFTPRVEIDFRRWSLFKLAVRCLVSPAPAYRLTFNGGLHKPHPPGQRVLEDLRRVARIDQGGLVVSPVTRVVDSHASIYRAGMQDMYLRIVKFIGLDEPGGE